VPLSDTSSEIAELRFAIHPAMSAERCLCLACEMSDFANKVQKTGIRILHPDWLEAKVMREVLRLAMLPEALPKGFDK
jgi:hypothetical protein